MCTPLYREDSNQEFQDREAEPRFIGSGGNHRGGFGGGNMHGGFNQGYGGHGHGGAGGAGGPGGPGGPGAGGAGRQIYVANVGHSILTILKQSRLTNTQLIASFQRWLARSQGSFQTSR